MYPDNQYNSNTVPPVLHIDGDKRIGTFIRRLNRFAVEILLDGTPAMAHLPNTGRMSELLLPGQTVLAIKGGHSIARKSHYDLLMVKTENAWVSVDSRVPNRLFRLAISQGYLSQFTSFTTIKAEATFEDSRIDFLLANDQQRCYVETKSVNLVQDKVALFPDAPTIRGRRHIESLCSAISQGFEAAVVFMIQRDDAESFSPNDVADPSFGVALRKAKDAGVGIYTYRCRATPEHISLASPVPVLL